MGNDHLWVAGILCAFFLMPGCAANKNKVTSGFDFTQLRRVSVMPFDGAGGQAVTDEFVRELVGAGLEVTDSQHPAAVVLKGTVTDYKANNAFIVFLGNASFAGTAGQSVMVKNPILSMSAPQVTPEGASASNHNAQMASVNAVVGVAARLVDTSNGSTVWSGSYTYEAIDIPGALHVVVGSLTGSLGRLLPQIPKRSS